MSYKQEQTPLAHTAGEALSLAFSTQRDEGLFFRGRSNVNATGLVWKNIEEFQFAAQKGIFRENTFFTLSVHTLACVAPS